MIRALITGASGQLGGHLAEHLVSAGVVVRGLARPTSDVRSLAGLPVEIVRSDVDDEATIRRAVDGVDWLFHLAGQFGLGSAFAAGSAPGPYQPVNVDFTELLLDTSLASGVRRFVFASSVGVYSIAARSPIREDAPLVPASPYGHSKLLGERLVQRYQQRGLATTIVRPCIMYGPSDRHFLPAALALARLPILPLPDGGRYRQDLVYVDDVVALLWQAVQSEAAIGKAYNAASGDAQPMRVVVAEVGRLMGVTPLTVGIPMWALRRFTRLGRWYLARFAPGVEQMFTPIGLAYLGRDVYYDVSLAEADLGYRPRFDLRRGLRLALQQRQP